MNKCIRWIRSIFAPCFIKSGRQNALLSGCRNGDDGGGSSLQLDELCMRVACIPPRGVFSTYVPCVEGLANKNAALIVLYNFSFDSIIVEVFDVLYVFKFGCPYAEIVFFSHTVDVVDRF